MQCMGGADAVVAWCSCSSERDREGTGRSRLGLAPSALALDVCGLGEVGTGRSKSG